MHLDAVKLAIGAGAQVVFHIARAADIFRVGRAAREFVEDDLVGLGQHIGEDIQAAAMGHAIDDFLYARATAMLDHRLQRRDHGFAAIEAKALGADIFAAQKLLILFAAHHGGQDRLLALGGEFDNLVGAFKAVLQELALLDIGNVHIF